MTSTFKKPLHIAIIAGEASGDLLGAGLIHALRKLNPDIQFEGIAGPQMLAAGCRSLYPMEKLSVMGLVEVLKHLPELLSIRRKITQHFLDNPPDVFIGIDAPDFNLAVEAKLKAAHIPTVHYVSPTVWAWRAGRIKKIARAVDLLLSILPFEEKFYADYLAKHHLNKNNHFAVKFIGHPLADTISVGATGGRPATPDFHNFKIAILPGSRANEIHYLGELFLRTALWLQQKNPNLSFVAPMANAARRAQFVAIQQKIAPQLKLEIIDGQAQQTMAAADVVLLASGTATLEAMLLKKPMVVAYRMSPFTHLMAQCLITAPHIALPNLLANKMLVPEFIQAKATVENLGTALLEYLNNPELVTNTINEFTHLHQQIRKDASTQAAQAVMQLING